MVKFLTDYNVMQRIANGDEQACHIVVKDHISTIYNVAMSISKNSIIADDITQETFIKLWKNAHKFNGQFPLHSWIYRIAVNTALSHVKTAKHHKNIDDIPIEDTGNLPDTILIKKENEQHIETAIAQLNEIEQTVLMLFYWDEVQIKDIAYALDMKPSTVESMLRRTRKKLEYLLSKDYDKPLGKHHEKS